MKDHVAVRLDPNTLSRVDAACVRLSTPWHTATRSDGLRALIMRGLDAYDAETPRAPTVTVTLEPERSE